MPEVGGPFLKHYPGEVEAILAAGEKDDARGLQIAAHSLKSNGAHIDAMHLSALANELEMMGRSGALEGAKDGEEKLRELAVRLEAEIVSSGQEQKAR